MSRFGKPVIEIGQYRFNKYLCSKGPTVRCVCVKHTAGWPVFTTSRFGKPVIEIGQYRFNKYHRSKGPKGLWVCVKQTAGCRATITTIDDVIIKCSNEHNH
ncbi:FLYWCH zinc finger domain-containing protein [Phthorimaea operculella]|nr:FLYWCH zinc finger domain-containing protein [Phthorimaea operculella]